MPLPAINYVWVGNPKFDQGGQDVIGPESVYAHMERKPEAQRNPIIFWCQSDYLAEYEAYFKTKKGMSTIQVKAIDNELENQSTNSEIPEEARNTAKMILRHYKTLTAKDRSKPLDCIYMKDMFFNYILATYGGYVSDTNITAVAPEVDIDFPDREKFTCPYLGKPYSIAEVWLQYAPQNNERAKQCLATYLTHYETMEKTIGRELYSEDHHQRAGLVAMAALELEDDIYKNSKELKEDSTCEFWDDLTVDDTLIVQVPELGVCKEYYNSHKLNAGAPDHYGKPHQHVRNGDIVRLAADLDHGISVNLTANHTTIDFKTKDETLLHLAVRNMAQRHATGEKGHENRKACVELLLARGADVTATHVFEENDLQTEQWALTYAIKYDCEEAVDLLLATGKIDVVNINKITSFTTPLMMAIMNNNTDMMRKLLDYGADPNRIVTMLNGATHSPLSVALRSLNHEAVKLLLEYHADPKGMVRSYGRDTPLEQIASSRECKQALLKGIGADPKPARMMDHYKQALSTVGTSERKTRGAPSPGSS